MCHNEKKCQTNGKHNKRHRRVCVCVCVCVRACACVVAFISYCHMSKPATLLRSCYILWFHLVETFFLITCLQSIIFLVFVCLLLMEYFFLARCVYVLLWRCNTSLTGLVFTRRLFLELLIFFDISSFIGSAKDSTHFLLRPFRSPFAQPYSTAFFYLSWCCHTSFICTFCGELISTS